MKMQVNEIFYSIQGESLFAGIPFVFVRLTGCNLRCSYCDTRYAYNQGTEMKMSTILERVVAYACGNVEITGGEPLLQKGTPRLITMLIENGYQVLLETNGSYDISAVDKRCVKIVDIKCPTSSESDKNDLNNIDRLTPMDQVKFVVREWKDYEFAREIIQSKCHKLPGSQILLSPVTEQLNPAMLAEWILKDRLNVRLHLQIHKILWPGIKRGV